MLNSKIVNEQRIGKNAVESECGWIWDIILEFVWSDTIAKEQWYKIVTRFRHSDLGTWTEGEITVTKWHIKIMISYINDNVLHVYHIRKLTTEKPKYFFPSSSWHLNGKCYMFPPQLTHLTVINTSGIVHPQLEHMYFPDIFFDIHIHHRLWCSFIAETRWLLQSKSPSIESQIIFSL